MPLVTFSSIIQIREITTPHDFAPVIILRESCRESSLVCSELLYLSEDVKSIVDTNGSEHGDENVNAVGGKEFSGRAEDKEMNDLMARQWRSHCIDPCIHLVGAYKGEKIVGGAKFRIVMGKREGGGGEEISTLKAR